MQRGFTGSIAGLDYISKNGNHGY